MPFSEPRERMSLNAIETLSLLRPLYRPFLIAFPKKITTFATESKRQEPKYLSRKIGGGYFGI